MCSNQRQQRNHGKQEPIKHHRPHAHLRQRNLPKEKPTPPQAARNRTSNKTQRPIRCETHPSTLAQRLSLSGVRGAPCPDSRTWVSSGPTHSTPSTKPGKNSPAPSDSQPCTQTP